VVNVLDTWYFKVKDVAYYWYDMVKWVVSTRYSQITNLLYYWYDRIKDVAYYWYGAIKWVVVTCYTQITNLLYYWYASLQQLVGLASKIVDFFTASFFTDLLAFLANPGPWIWAYIIGLAEEKIGELMEKYW